MQPKVSFCNYIDCDDVRPATALKALIQVFQCKPAEYQEQTLAVACVKLEGIDSDFELSRYPADSIP